MPKGNLIAIKAKLKWAEAQIDHLKHDFFSSTKEPTNRIVFHEDPDGLHASINTAEPALEWAFIAGTVIHHVRSCLDHLVYQLALQHPNKVRQYIRVYGQRKLSRTLHFPIYTDPNDFAANWKVKHLASILSKREFAAIKSAQPYKRNKAEPTKHWLNALNTLNNIDKHRTILVIDKRANVVGGIESGIGKWTFQTGPQKVKPGAKFMTLSGSAFGPQTKVKVDKVTFFITFNDTGVCDDSSVITTLRDMRRDVEALIDKRFAKFFK